MPSSLRGVLFSLNSECDLFTQMSQYNREFSRNNPGGLDSSLEPPSQRSG